MSRLLKPAAPGDGLRSYQVAQSWYGWDGSTAVLRVYLCIPLAMLETNQYGCNVLPDWTSHFHRSAVKA